MYRWHPQEAGTITTTSAARTGSCGLWTYTAETSDHSFCYTYQSLGAVQGQIFRGQSYARGVTESSGGSWVPGSFVCVRVSFLDPGGATIASYESLRVTEAGDSWDSLAVVTDPVPPGTDSVQFALLFDILDYCYYNEIMAVVTVDWDGTYSTKPMFISEFGTDAFRTLRSDSPYVQGYVDEAMQAEFNTGLWGEIRDNLSVTIQTLYVQAERSSSGAMSGGRLRCPVCMNHTGITRIGIRLRFPMRSGMKNISVSYTSTDR